MNDTDEIRIHQSTYNPDPKKTNVSHTVHEYNHILNTLFSSGWPSLGGTLINQRTIREGQLGDLERPENNSK